MKLTASSAANITIPGAEVSLNQADLLTKSRDLQTTLIEKLRQYFDETSREALLQRRKNESDHAQSELNKSPMTIFIG